MKIVALIFAVCLIGSAQSAAAKQTTPSQKCDLWIANIEKFVNFSREKRLAYVPRLKYNLILDVPEAQQLPEGTFVINNLLIEDSIDHIWLPKFTTREYTSLTFGGGMLGIGVGTDSFSKQHYYVDFILSQVRDSRLVDVQLLRKSNISWSTASDYLMKIVRMLPSCKK